MSDQVTNLGRMLECFIAMERTTLRELAPRIGISPSTLHRVCKGQASDAATLLKIMNWLMQAQ